MSVSVEQIFKIAQPMIELLARLIEARVSRPAPQPTPSGGNTDRLPDDEHIPAPPVVVAAAATPARVTLTLRQAQYNRGLFPDTYTDQNPMGLYSDPMGMVARNEAFNRLSKLWLDLTAYDADGHELTGGRLVAANLAFRTEHKFTDEQGRVSRITGAGQREDGSPQPWQQVEDSSIGFGVTAWINSLGCNMAAKAWGEGTFTVVGSLGGVTSNMIVFRVS